MEADQPMAHSWDGLTKMLVRANPQDLVSLVLDGAQYVGEHNTEMQARTIRADLSLDVRINECKVILHVEFQKQRDTSMGRRMWEYNAVTDYLHNCPVYSVVIYLRQGEKDGKTGTALYQRMLPNGEAIYSFAYKKIELWNLSSQWLQEHAKAGMLPFLPLTRDGARRETIEAMITGLQEAGQHNLLPLGYAFAALVFEEDADKAWLQWRFQQMQDILEESWAYQEMTQKALTSGLQQGLERGLEQGLEKGRMEEVRSVLTRYVGKRFSPLTPLARQQVMLIDELATLENILDKLYDAQTVDEAQEILLAANKITDDSVKSS